LAINHGLFSIVAEADIQDGFAAVVEASSVGRAFAAAVVLGQYLGGRSVRDRCDECVRRRAMTAD
jgi:hypothetical protein